jgi:hypothetical protein
LQVSGTASGCQNNGTCYYQALPQLPSPGLPLCGCLFNYVGPTCATPGAFFVSVLLLLAGGLPRRSPARTRLVTPPICKLGVTEPPACVYCNPLTNEGCFNGGEPGDPSLLLRSCTTLSTGTCYYQSLAGVPPPGLPICGCSYAWAAPNCQVRGLGERSRPLKHCARSLQRRCPFVTPSTRPKPLPPASIATPPSLEAPTAA